jgi:hypothetical protein
MCAAKCNERGAAMITLTKDQTETVRIREIEIEFKEWMHPQLGVVPVDPKTPLILKAVIREKVQ